MNTIRICQRCQKPIPEETPLGLCPECLIRAGFHSGDGSESGPTGRKVFVPPALEEMAQLFPQLEILSLVGHGGMGAVYKARQKQLNRVVALKILPPGIGSDPGRVARFTREAQALAQLNHPGIVTLYEFGQAGGMHFFLMEFVDGVNLGQALLNGRISSRESLSIVVQVCEALQFAHDQGVVHRDIKPENILLDRRGRVKVADFGLAMLAGGNGEPVVHEGQLAGSVCLTEAGKVVGTPRYMSPEQLEHPAEVDHRADIYALGVVFYQMLTGELPGKRIEPPSHRVQLDVRLDEVVLRALEPKAERRFQHASELKTCVESIAGRPQGAGEKGTLLKALSRRMLLGTLALAALVICLGVALALRSPRTQPPTSPRPYDLIAQTIQNEIGRQLREAGAVYDDLQVTVAIERDSAPPFNVQYRGLRNFKGQDGTIPQGNGSFVVNYIGGGQWQGLLAGTQFTVPVGSRDQINLPFVNDPQVLGGWKSVDFVQTIAEFNPESRAFKNELFLKELTFLPEGKTPQPWFTWSKGVLIHHGDQTTSHYEIHILRGGTYLFLEWKSGDFTIFGKKPWYYVLQKTNT